MSVAFGLWRGADDADELGDRGGGRGKERLDQAGGKPNGRRKVGWKARRGEGKREKISFAVWWERSLERDEDLGIDLQRSLVQIRTSSRPDDHDRNLLPRPRRRVDSESGFAYTVWTVAVCLWWWGRSQWYTFRIGRRGYRRRGGRKEGLLRRKEVGMRIDMDVMFGCWSTHLE
jgi:hypothetical protein